MDDSSVSSDVDNLVCPGNVAEYCTIDGDQIVKRCSIVSIVDTNTTSYVVLIDGVILQPKQRSVRKVQMYYSATGGLVTNPLPC